MRSSAKLTLGAAAVLAGWISAAGLVGQALVVEEPIERAEAIVVLSGSAEYRNRAQAAARLWRRGIAPDVFITDDGHQAGWDTVLQRNPAFFELMKRGLEAEGVPPERIILIPGQADGTHEEAILISEFLREKEVRSVMLVTSGFHTRRTKWTFERISALRGGDVAYGISCPTADKHLSSEAFWWLTSSGWRDIPSEVLKLMYYRWSY